MLHCCIVVVFLATLTSPNQAVCILIDCNSMDEEACFVFLIWHKHINDLIDAYSAGLKIIQQDHYVQENFVLAMVLKPAPILLQPWKLSLDHPHAPLSQLSQ